MVSRRFFVLTLIGVCVLSAAIGAATTLLIAERGATGPQGVRGPAGPAGSGADEALYRVDDLEGQVSDLDSRVISIEYDDPSGAISDLDWRVADVESSVRGICRALDLFCP